MSGVDCACYLIRRKEGPLRLRLAAGGGQNPAVLMAARALVVLLVAGVIAGAATEPLQLKLLTPSVQDRGQGWLQVRCSPRRDRAARQLTNRWHLMLLDWRQAYESLGRSVKCPALAGRSD